MTGMVFVVGAGAADRMPGSTPTGGRITPDPDGAAGSNACDWAGGAIFSGGVGDGGGVGPGGAWVTDGGLDGCAIAGAPVSASAITAATPSKPARRRSASV